MAPRRGRALALLLISGRTARAAYNWTECEKRVLMILDGQAVIDGVDNSTITNYLYHGYISGLDSNYPRQDYLAVTYEGCRKICGNPIAIYDPAKSLALVANWVFPLTILLSLPYESLHEGRFHRTLIAILNWLGSPQTALTATIFNFRQFRQSHRRVLRDAGDHRSHLRCAAYFVLCSLNQFDLKHSTLLEHDGRMLKVLVYGLFRPLSNDAAPDVELTDQLLVQLAFQLRMLRRRGVIPMLANLATFLVAFVFSVVLAFAELGDDNTPFSLAFGLLMTWLPLLVVFTIVDRNPVSSERTAELISRWFYNVEGVKIWAETNRQESIRWWTGTPNRPQAAGIPPAAGDPPATNSHPAIRVSHFIGQGRRIRYCGLPHAFLEVAEDANFDFGTATPRSLEADEETPTNLEAYAAKVAQKLQGRKPLAWYVVAVLSFLLVWTAIMSAFVVSFTAPTVGLGCRTLTYLLFGGFSSVSWVIQLFWNRPPRWALWPTYVFNALAVAALLVVIVFQVTGLASNCFCKSSALNMPLLGGYVDFKGYAFYREHFNVMPYWIGGAVVGGLVPTIAFVVALFWWLKCNHLWKANERQREYQLWSARAPTDWLQ